MLEYERIDISEGIDLNKGDKLKECDICHYWYFLDKKSNYKPYLCNGCNDLMQKVMSYVAVVMCYVLMLLLFLLNEVIIEFIFGI